MNLYIGNLSRTVTEEALKHAFEQFGTVTSVKIIIDRMTGEPRGFAFVDMPNDDEANAAMEQLNNQEFDGQRIRVNEARPQEQRRDRKPRSGGSGMGGGRGGFGGGSSNGGGRPFNRFGGNNRSGRSSDWRD